MAVCDACGWEGDADDTRPVIGFDPGICPKCLSVHVSTESTAADADADASLVNPDG